MSGLKGITFDGIKFLNALHRQHSSELVDRELQIQLSRDALVPKSISEKHGEAEIRDLAIRLRKTARDKFRPHLKGKYSLEDFFQLGPQETVTSAFLQKVGWKAPKPRKTDEENTDEEIEDTDGTDEYDDESEAGDDLHDDDYDQKSAQKKTKVNWEDKGSKSAAQSTFRPEAAVVATSSSGTPVTTQHLDRNSKELKQNKKKDKDAKKPLLARASSTETQAPFAGVAEVENQETEKVKHVLHLQVKSQGQKRTSTGLEEEQEQDKQGAAKRQKQTQTPGKNTQTSSSEAVVRRNALAQTHDESSTTGLLRGMRVRVKNDKANDTKKLLSYIESNIQHAVQGFCGESSIDRDAPSIFIHEPPSALQELYRTLVTDDRWAVWALEQHGAVGLKQDCTIAGLFGVGILKDVLRAELPFSISKQMSPSLQKAIAAANQNWGIEPEAFLQSVAKEQSYDQDFVGTEIIPFVKAKVQALIGMLQPHLLSLTKLSKGAPNRALPPSRPQQWVDFLEKAYEEATIMKLRLDAERRGPFEYRWPKAGEKIDYDHHRVYGDGPGDKILHPLLPGIWSKHGEKFELWHEAYVVPASFPAAVRNA